MFPVILLSLLASTVIAKPVERGLFSPTVKISNGTIVGSTAGFLVDSFLGIPFAQPPVGNLRLKPPQPITKNWGTLQATSMPRACPQFPIQIDLDNQLSEVIAVVENNPITQAALNFGEDCLTLNIYRPFGVSSNAKLPVVFWIFGGGFELGWTGMYDFTQWIQQSMLYGKPVIMVAVNYRLGGFGFLAGNDLANEHSTNLGLRDQRLGLQWVAENIAAFGGDPDKVTIWGESAGAISVCDHTVINNGDNTYKGKPLFRGAIMNSGSLAPADNVTTQKAQDVYNQVVKAAGCSGASDRLACLRATDYQTFLTATQTVPGIIGAGGLDLSYLPRPDAGDSFYAISAQTQIASGRFAKVPTIIGDLLDEGTLFSTLAKPNLTTNEDLVDYLAHFFQGAGAHGRADVAGLTALYPDKPNEGQPDGSPFGTGPLYNFYPQQKRLAAILGDITFTISRRTYLDMLVKNGVTTYSYMANYLSGPTQLPVLGTFHASDLVVLFNPLTQWTLQRATWQNYYISFFNNLDPNTISSFPRQISWPKYSSDTRQIINIGSLGTTQATDDFRQEVADYLYSKSDSFHI